MANLEILGYTVVHMDTTLMPTVLEYNGESEKHLSLNCKSMAAPDNSEGVLSFDVTIDVRLPKDQDSEERDPILATNAQFMFSFAPDESVSEDELMQMITTAGVQIAIPIIRGILAGVGNMLNHPDVYDFATFKPEIITWHKDDDTE